MEDDPESSHPRARATKELAISIYRGVWNEFYAWNADECRRLESRLRRDVAALRSSSSHIENMAEAIANMNDSVPLREIHLPGSEPPCQSYYSCTPTNSMLLGANADVDETSTLNFLPYADDEKFDVVNYAFLFDYLAWDDLQDPNLELIQYETARRLHVDHGFLLEDIDRLCDMKPLRVTNELGVVWAMSQRDVPAWHRKGPDIPTCQVPARHDLLARVQSFSSFCGNLNCLLFRCSLHKTSLSPRDPAKPLRTQEALHHRPGSPCGDNCFRTLTDDDDRMNSVSWHENDANDVDVVMSITPDASPCDLAILCRKPCFEIYVYRSRKYSDEEIWDNYRDARKDRHRVHPLSGVRKPKFDFARLLRFETYTLPGPCNHKGACHDKDVGCECAKMQVHCQRDCRCHLDCKYRWAGCNCKGHGACKWNPDTEPSCVCVKAGRECDPDLCVSCDARRSGSGSKCRNVQILHGDSQPVVVKAAKYGVGAFAAQRIGAKKLIGLYAGEKLSEYLPRNDTVSKHTDLNYLFRLDESNVIDGARAGNVTRYLNDGKESSNCISRILRVNGDLYIGIFTTEEVAAGKELLLNYGEMYWR